MKTALQNNIKVMTVADLRKLNNAIGARSRISPNHSQQKTTA